MKYNEIEGDLLVLGASSDIGKALIASILANGLTGRIFSHYFSNSESFEVFGEKVVPVYGDFSTEKGTLDFLEQIGEMANLTGVVVLPSLKYRLDRFRAIEWEAIENRLSIELRATFLILKKVTQQLVKRRTGKIVFMLSSVTQERPPIGSSAYTISKYAQLGLMRSLAAEFAAYNIQVNSVSPSMVETKFLDNLDEKVLDIAKLSHPLKRLATVDEISGAIVFLLSKESNYMSGQNLLIAGQ